VQRVRYKDILQQLDIALDFCRSLGLSDRVEQSRFHEYLQRIRFLVKMIATDLTEAKWEAALGRAEQRLMYHIALLEGLEFSEILSHARPLNRTGLQQTLRAILNARAPVLPVDEDANSNESRNRLFELNLAAKLLRARVNVSLGEPDLICELDGRRTMAPSRVYRSLGRGRLDQPRHGRSSETYEEFPELDSSWLRGTTWTNM
jgi:hypothetical protein